MHNLRKISVVFAVVLLISMLFVSCDKIKKSNDVVEIKAEKVVTPEVTQEKKAEPEVVVVGIPEVTEEKVAETVAVVEEKVEAASEVVEEKVEETVAVAESEAKKVEETVAVVEEKVAETVAAAETKVEETVAVVEEKVEQTVAATEEKVAETVAVASEKVETAVAVAETKVEEAVASAETKVEEKVSEVVFNPPVVSVPKTVPAVKSKSENKVGVEFGVGASYYRLEYKDYKADMFKLSVPLYFHIPAGDSFTISAYAKPAYLKELQKDKTSSSLESTQNFSLDFGLGLGVHNEKIGLDAEFGIDLFNEGKKFEDKLYAMFNAQVVPSFRLGNSSLWISIPVEFNFSPVNKDNMGYGAGLCLTLRTDIK